MKFKEAVLSGKKVRSEYWENNVHLDTSIFSDNIEDWMKDLLCKTAKPLTWKEILGDWKLIMDKYEIWCEGYLCTGMEGNPEKAHYFGTQEGESFKDACIKFFTKDKKHNDCFNVDSLTYWGCRLFDNETDARKNFG